VFKLIVVEHIALNKSIYREKPFLCGMLSKKAQILQAAAGLFRQKGFAATSMQDIAEQMDMKAASLYNHIESKQELLRNILMEVANDFIVGMDAIKCSSLSSSDKLKELISLHVRLTTANPDNMAMLIGDWTHLDEDHKKKYLKLRDSYEDDFRKILKECMQDGYLKTVDIEIALFSILSTLRWTYSWYTKQKNISRLDLEADLYKCLIEGLKKPST